MDEPDVVLLIRKHFEAQGYKMKGQPDEGDVALNGGELRVDLQGFKVGSPPDLLWIECKGDTVSLKDLLSDFVSLLLVLDTFGGQAVFACPSESYAKIMMYNEFLERLQYNISKGAVTIVNVESIQM